MSRALLLLYAFNDVDPPLRAFEHVREAGLSSHLLDYYYGEQTGFLVKINKADAFLGRVEAKFELISGEIGHALSQHQVSSEVIHCSQADTSSTWTYQ